MEQEEAIRRLASTISLVIRKNPDVLENRSVIVPELSQAEFDPTVDYEIIDFPKAHRFLNDFLSTGDQNPVQEIIVQLKSVERLLAWGHAPGYNTDNVGQEFLDNYCHALLTGPDGPLKCASPLGAFVLFGPNTLYRDHWHTPNEVYIALTGGGEWRVGHQPWMELEAGQTIYIPSNAVHAIRTTGRPLLTFSFWLEAGDMDEIVI